MRLIFNLIAIVLKNFARWLQSGGVELEICFIVVLLYYEKTQIDNLSPLLVLDHINFDGYSPVLLRGLLVKEQGFSTPG